ncbi:MAG TPA: hypothetical protein VFQ91_26455 [Bryobacteraceae bacterium]|nr:hypothetical protein [Bryobacteraceae bacterium]
MIRSKWTFASLLFLTGGVLCAHAVWVEKEKGVAKAYFGEWDEDKREIAGKLLDYIRGPQAFQGSSKTSLPLTKESNHFAIPVKGTGDIRVIESTIPVNTNKNTGLKSKGIYIAKYGRTETAAASDLELVPVAANANTFRLLLRGAAAPKVQVEVVGPPRWRKSFMTDDQGQVTIETPWAGPYLLEAVHVVKGAGGEGADAYDQIRFVTTVFFENAKGISWKK